MDVGGGEPHGVSEPDPRVAPGIRAHRAQRRGPLRREQPGILEGAENGLPALSRKVLAGLLKLFRDFDTRVTACDRQIHVLAAASEPARQFLFRAPALRTDFRSDTRCRTRRCTYWRWKRRCNR